MKHNHASRPHVSRSHVSRPHVSRPHVSRSHVSRSHVSRFTSSSALVLGLGNPLRGDDGIGPRVVEELNRRGLPEGVAALDGGTGGLDLLNVLEGRERVVVVDAADIGQEPGQFVCFTPEEVRLAQSKDALSLHHAGLAEALALAEALDLPLPEITILGVQPAMMEWGEGLSPAVEATLPDLVDAVLECVKCDT